MSEHNITTLAGTAAGSGDNTLIAAPGAGLCIVLVRVQLQNETANETTAILKDGEGTNIERCIGANKGDGIRPPDYSPDARPRCGANKALVLNLSAANQFGYVVHYYLEHVP